MCPRALMLWPLMHGFERARGSSSISIFDDVGRFRRRAYRMEATDSPGNYRGLGRGGGRTSGGQKNG